MTNDIISVLVPTRGMPQPLEASVRSIRHLADRPGRIEILLRVDHDDPVDYEREVWRLFAAKGAPRVLGRVIRGVRHGYGNLHVYINELAALARGRWLFPWGDDNFMATQGWDTALDRIRGDIVVATTESNHGRSPCTFPILTSGVFMALGHVSLNCHYDTWIEQVAEATGVLVAAPITIFHAYFSVRKEKDARTTDDFCTEASRQLRIADVMTLRAALRRPSATY